VRFSDRLRRRLSDIRRRTGTPDWADPARGSMPDPPRPVATVRTTPWVEHPRLTDPPPFREVETARGPIAVRSLTIPIPSEIREGLPDEVTGEAPALYVDTETLGLGSEPIFLVGMATVRGGEVHLEQVFAPDVAREPALLAHWVARASATGLLISYNGKSYDLPLLTDRAARQRLRVPGGRAHADLLHPARHRWKKEIRDVKLISLEWHLFGRNRPGDVPGREIPGLYRRASRAGDLRLLAPVFHHNALDLLTLIELTPLLAPIVPELGGTRPARPKRPGKKQGARTSRASKDAAASREHPTASTGKHSNEADGD